MRAGGSTRGRCSIEPSFSRSHARVRYMIAACVCKPCFAAMLVSRDNGRSGRDARLRPLPTQGADTCDSPKRPLRVATPEPAVTSLSAVTPPAKSFRVAGQTCSGVGRRPSRLRDVARWRPNGFWMIAAPRLAPLDEAATRADRGATRRPSPPPDSPQLCSTMPRSLASQQHAPGCPRSSDAACLAACSRWRRAGSTVPGRLRLHVSTRACTRVRRPRARAASCCPAMPPCVARGSFSLCIYK